jgi:hypothetical protein
MKKEGTFDDFNPYAAPEAPALAKDQTGYPIEMGLWRDRGNFVMSRDFPLPLACIVCGEPCERRLKRVLRWHAPGWYIAFFISPLLYILVALIVSWRATIHVGVCARHRRRRLWAILIGWLSIPAGVFLMIAGAPSDYSVVFVLAGIVVMVTGLVYGVVVSRIVTPKRIDQYFIWLGAVHSSFLRDLPDWPGRKHFRVTPFVKRREYPDPLAEEI